MLKGFEANKIKGFALPLLIIYPILELSILVLHSSRLVWQLGLKVFSVLLCLEVAQIDGPRTRALGLANCKMQQPKRAKSKLLSLKNQDVMSIYTFIHSYCNNPNFFLLLIFKN